MQMKAGFGFGDMVVDTYSGFRGQVTAVCFYMTGCVQYCVHAKKMKDKKPLEGVWLHGSRLKLRQKRKRRTPEKLVADALGISKEGPQRDPPPDVDVN